MKLFAVVPILLAWLPEIVKAVAIFEAVLDPHTPGSEKKSTVMAYLSQVAAKSKLPWGTQAVAVIGSVIDTVVGVLNFIGTFQHKADMDAEEVKQVAAASPVKPSEAKAKVAAAAANDDVFQAFLTKTGA